MRDKPFSFEAQGANVRNQQLVQGDRDRYISSGRSLAWVPRLTNHGTAPTPLNATGTGYYTRTNDQILFDFYFPNSTQLGSGTWEISLPVQASIRSAAKTLFWHCNIVVEGGAGAWFGVGGINSVNPGHLVARVQTAFGASFSNLNATTPFAWFVTAGTIHGWGWYEAESGFTEVD